MLNLASPLIDPALIDHSEPMESGEIAYRLTDGREVAHNAIAWPAKTSGSHSSYDPFGNEPEAA